MYYGRCKSRLAFSKSPKQNSCSKFKNLTKTIFQYTIHENEFFHFFFLSFFVFFILQMLGIDTFVFGHQESIAAISLT